jgi:hypothetical protein
MSVSIYPHQFSLVCGRDDTGADVPIKVESTGEVHVVDYADLRTYTYYSARVASGATVIAGIAGKKHRIHMILLSVASTGTVTISDGIGVYDLTLNRPFVMPFFGYGILQGTANTDITVTNSAAGNISVNILYSTEDA